MNTNSFGEWLRARRDHLGLTRKEVAEAAFCSVDMLRKIEDDEQRPSEELGRLLAAKLRIPAEQQAAFVEVARGERPLEALAVGDGDNNQSIGKALSAAETLIVPVNHETPNNLPPQPTPFIGRHSELSTLHDFIVEEDAALVTIVGPGGMGKTRLALAFAEGLVEAQSPTFSDGIFFIDLAPLEEVAHILPTLAEGLNFSLKGDETDERPPRQKVMDYLREKQMLLIMDNFEHLLEGADLVSDILGTASGVKIIATSRERLHLRQEQVYPISGLEFPDWETPEDAARYTAVQLFLQSAQRNLPDFELNDHEDLTYLARICRMVAGMPLAIELAAGWVDTLSLAEIAEEIKAGLDFLETEMRDVPERHRSVRAAIDYSWQKLTAEEKQVFAQLSVFRGGFSRRAGTTITEASIRLLSRLVNKSFLQYNHARERYQVHELMRQFGAETLADDGELETAVRQRHSDYYCRALGEKTADLKGYRQKEAIEVIEPDIENARAAWNWAVRNRETVLLDAALFSLFQFYDWHGRYQDYEEAVATAISALDYPRPLPEQAAVLIRLLHRKIDKTWDVAEKEAILNKTSDLLAGMEQAGADTAVPEVTAVLQAQDAYYQGILLRDRHDYPQAEKVLKKSLGYFKASGDVWYEVRVLVELGLVAVSDGKYPEAEEHGQAAHALAQKLGDRWGLIYAYDLLALNANIKGKFSEMRRRHQEVLETARDLGHLPLQGMALRDIGTSFTAEGRLKEALPYHQDSLAILRQTGDRGSTSWGMTMLAIDNMFLGQFEAAEQWLRQGKKAAKESQNVEFLIYYLNNRSLLALLKGQYETALDLSLEAKSLLDTPGSGGIDMMAIVWSILGWCQFVLGAYVETEKSLLRSLIPGTVWGRSGLAVIAFLLVRRKPDLEGIRQAWQLIGLYEQSSLWARYKLLRDFMEPFQPPEMLALPEEEIEALKEIGRSLDPDTVIEELLEELPKSGWGQEEPIPQAKQSIFISQTSSTSPVIEPPVMTPPQERFVQEKLIAAGGMGEVYLGRDTATGEQVAIKRLKPELAKQNPQLIARFAREGEALRRLNHPNIVKVLATIEDENAPTIIMEYVGGGDLQQLIDTQEQIPLNRVLDIALELSDALSRAHHLGIIHRDLKPANVLLATDGTPRLTDFGIALLEQQGTRLTQEGTFMGSPAYLSPELVEGQEADHRSDIWAFGVMLYEMTAGQHPFEKNQFAATLGAILTDAPLDIGSIRPDVPPELGHLIGEMLVKERDGRLASMRLAGARLEAIRQL